MATVLIADDDAAVRRLLAAVLRPRGHTVVEAGNGEQALELAGSVRPGLIVSDLLMPVMDGYELVRRLRIAPDTANTPVIFLTAEYDDEGAELARAAGVSRILRKPCSPSDVVVAVETALGECPRTDTGEITGSFNVRHLRLMADKLTRQARDLREANERLEAHAAQLEREIAERRAAAEKLGHLNRVHAMVSSITTAIVHVKNRGQLLEEACRMAVDHGRFRFAWVGLVDDDDAHTIRIVSAAGIDPNIANRLGRVFPLDHCEGRSLVREALLRREAMICNDLVADQDVIRHGEELVRAGYRAMAVLPLIVNDKPTGVFAIYASEANFFDAGELHLLIEVAKQVSFALDHIVKTEQLDYVAFYDPLTGLANRTLLMQRLARDIEAASGRDSLVALIMFDMSRFEHINDSLGREVGDQVLKTLAERLVQCLGDPSHAARVGPDQLVAVIPDARSENDVARAVVDWSCRIFNAPFPTAAQELRLSGKAGIALYPADGADPETLLNHAETALRKCKAGSDPYLFYTQDMSKRTAERLALEIRLRAGVEKEEFVLHYQPKIDTRTGRLAGVEALVRWHNPTLGLVAPAQFIPLMEETGLIVDAGRWALRRVIADRRAWLERGLEAPRIAINVSAVELRKQDFVDHFVHMLETAGDDPGIDIEVTESIIMENVAANIAKLLAIRQLGVEIAIDDFGTGYSSLGYLARLPVQVLKIDRTFVASMLEDPSAMTLVSTMVSLARSLKLTAVAEGVEHEDQARMLRLLRCDQMQGFLFDRPLTFDAMTDRLASRRNWMDV